MRVYKCLRSFSNERLLFIGFINKKGNFCDFWKCNEDDIGCVDKVLV